MSSVLSRLVRKPIACLVQWIDDLKKKDKEEDSQTQSADDTMEQHQQQQQQQDESLLAPPLDVRSENPPPPDNVGKPKNQFSLVEFEGIDVDDPVVRAFALNDLTQKSILKPGRNIRVKYEDDKLLWWEDISDAEVDVDAEDLIKEQISLELANNIRKAAKPPYESGTLAEWISRPWLRGNNSFVYEDESAERSAGEYTAKWSSEPQ